jgi:hypothetical protein
MTASKARVQTWLTIFEITVGPRARASEFRRGQDPQRGSAYG